MRGAGSTSLLGRAVLQQPFSHLLMLLGQFGPRLRHDQAAVEPELHILFPTDSWSLGWGRVAI